MKALVIQNTGRIEVWVNFNIRFVDANANVYSLEIIYNEKKCRYRNRDDLLSTLYNNISSSS